MPTNLPPESQAAEKRYREAKTLPERIATLEEFIATIPKHKGTDHLRADLRRRLSRLKEEAQSGKRGAKRDTSYYFPREGAGQVVVIGPTNSGKSALVAALTNATPEVSEAPFTTWDPLPGMMPFENIQIQLIDTPPLNRDFVEPEMLNLLRRADLVLLVIDLQADPLDQLEEALALLEEHRIVPRHRQERYRGEQHPSFVPLVVLVNKHDDEHTDEDFQILLELLPEDCPLLPVSTLSGRNLDYLKRVVFERLEIVRVYAKPPGRDPDYTAPYVLKRGATVEDLAGRVHRDFLENLKSARVWGSGIYDGQAVGRDHVLHDGDVVELRI